ncbi:hypothetical protein FEG41_18915 [Acinetobacter baumannii]|nr:hypothetical protein FEG41_18915 [Acinetobacter baumannii]
MEKAIASGIRAKATTIPARTSPRISVHDKFQRTLILSWLCIHKIAKISLNSYIFPKQIKR